MRLPRPLVAALIAIVPAAASATRPPADWQPLAPAEHARWNVVKLAEAEAYARSVGTVVGMIVEDGRVVARWGDLARPLVSWSIRKSLISALYGIAADRGRLRPDATLAELGIDDLTPLTDAEKQARIVDLLGSRSGVYLPVDFESPRMKATRPARGSRRPGEYFYYNNWDFNALGTIYEQATGDTIGAAFARDIAAPTAMQDFRPADVYWLRGPVSRHGAFHFAISTRDLARFGQLYLDGGRWAGRQVVPAGWVRRSTTSTGPVDYAGWPSGGYEYLWWVADKGVHLPGLKLDGAYSARGAGGHHLLVIPGRRLVIVARGDNEPASHSLADVSAAGLKPGATAEQFGRLVALTLAARRP